MKGMTILPAADIVQGNNEFALDLYSRLAQAENSNLFFSPYSISSALAMTFAGACGSTEQEMASVLRFPAEQDRLHAAFSKLNEQIFAGENHGYKIKAANRLWGQKGYRFGAAFLQLLRTRYGSDLGIELSPMFGTKTRSRNWCQRYEEDSSDAIHCQFRRTTEMRWMNCCGTTGCVLSPKKHPMMGRAPTLHKVEQ